MINKKVVLNAIENGMVVAQQRYCDASGTFFNNCSEYYFRAIVFDFLLKETGSDTLTLETKYTELAESVKNTPWGRVIKDNIDGTRCDIACWDSQSYQPMAFIEIKKSAKVYKTDITRLYRATKGTEAIGIFGGLIKKRYTTKCKGDLQKTKHYLNQQSKTLESDISQHLSNLNKNYSVELHHPKGVFLTLRAPYQHKESWAYRPVCFVIKSM